MHRACEIAQRAKGHAEPNPTVGCVIAVGDTVLAEGWTQDYGTDHAEVHTIGRVSPSQKAQLADATLYVTLEPCCHQGKTPPCTSAILATPIKRVIVGVQDPFPQVAGQGIQLLREAGIEVIICAEEQVVKDSLAPFLKAQQLRLPWVIAKWAMTLDGKIATAQGDSKWISSAESRKVVHGLRGRMDAVMVGIGTALADDPLLTARPAGPRMALRIVVDSMGRLPLSSQLAATANDIPVLLAVGNEAPQDRLDALASAGLEILPCDGDSHAERLESLLIELGKRRATNVLVEGGAELLGSLLHSNHIDEVHAFIAPKMIGGEFGVTAGNGRSLMEDAWRLRSIHFEQIDNDMYVSGLVEK